MPIKATDSPSVTAEPAIDPLADCLRHSNPKAQQILQAAGAVFFEQGFGSASMGQIAARAGVSKGTLYNYFADKEALFAAVVRGTCEYRNEALYALEPGDTDVPAVLRRVARDFVVFVNGELPVAGFRIVIAEALRFPHLGRIFYEAGPAEGVARLATYLDWAVGETLIAIDEPPRAAREFLEMTKMSVHMERLLNLRDVITEAEAGPLADRAVEYFLKLYPLQSG